MKTNSKKSKILKTFNLLSTQALEVENIAFLLKISNARFYKIINFLKKADIKTSKLSKKYFISNFNSKEIFHPIEKSMAAYLLLIAHNYLPFEKSNAFFEMMETLLHFTSKKDHKEIIEKFEKYKLISTIDNYSKKSEILSKSIEKKETIKIITNKNTTILLTPLKLSWENNKLSLIGLENDNQTIIPLDKIANIIPTKEQKIINYPETIFELYGNLAKKYHLKEDEVVVDWSEEKIAISNTSANKEALFRRLLKYDVLCKVIAPKKDREEFKKIIDKALDNLDKFEDNI